MSFLFMCVAKRWLIAGAVCCAILGFEHPAEAAHSCTVAADDLIFGNYSALNSANVDTIGTITVDCSGSDNISVNAVVDVSAGSSGTFNPRTMLSGASTLDYNVYVNAGHSTIWGDGTGGSVTRNIRCNLRGPPTTCTGTRTMYGRIPIGQNVSAGGYVDTLIVTITY